MSSICVILYRNTTGSHSLTSAHARISNILTKFKPGNFVHNDSGNIALMFALMLPILFGIVGLGVDAGQWFKERSELQTIVDAAVIAAALENASGANSTQITSGATLEATRNGFDATTDTLTYVGTPTTGSYAGDTSYIEVTATRQLNGLLSQVFFVSNFTTTARAVASSGGGTSNACMLSLNTTAQKAIEISGNASISASGCIIASNSSHSSSIEITGSAAVTADSLSTVGDYLTKGASTLTTTTSPQTGASAISDPYSSVAVPAYSGCDQSEYKVNPSSNVTITPSSSTTPYVFCQGLDIKGTMSLDPGIFVIDGGTFNLNAGAVLTGTDVTLILTSSTGSGYAKYTMNGSASVNLTAPSTGTYAGILMYGDRDGPNQVNTLNGNSSATFNGALYFPSSELDFEGNSSGGGSSCTQLIADTIKVTGGTGITTSGCVAAGATLATTSGATQLSE